MTLNYLEFDYSEDTQGIGTLDAMASVGPQQVAAVRLEIERVLNWAFAAFGDTHGAVEEGADWDYDLQSQQEHTLTEDLVFDPDLGQLMESGQRKGVPRHTLTLSLSGSPAFCQAFQQAFLSN